MVEIAAIEVTNSDAWWIVDQLRTSGRADDTTAASAIEYGITHDEAIDSLTPEQELALLFVLAGGPNRLESLRDNLARDHYDRT